MNKLRLPTLLGMLTPTLWLFGCATSPAALEQANHTVKLMSLMEEPLGDYRETWSALEHSRLQTLKAQRRFLTKSNLVDERSRMASTAAGGVKQEALRAKLLAQADAMQAARGKGADDVKSYDTKLDALLQPLPSTTASVTAAQTAVAKLGVELSSETRAKELYDFAQEVWRGLNDGKKARDEAKAAADATAENIVQNIEKQNTSK